MDPLPPRRHYRHFKPHKPRVTRAVVIIAPPLPPPIVAIGTYKLCDPITGLVFYVELRSDGRIHDKAEK